MANKILEREKKKLGKCNDGKQYVDPNFVKMLVNMGFSKRSAIVALQQTNNIISDSVQYIQEHPQPGPSQTRSKEMMELIEDLIPEVRQFPRVFLYFICILFSWNLLVLIVRWQDWL